MSEEDSLQLPPSMPDQEHLDQLTPAARKAVLAMRMQVPSNDPSILRLPDDPAEYGEGTLGVLRQQAGLHIGEQLPMPPGQDRFPL